MPMTASTPRFFISFTICFWVPLTWSLVRPPQWSMATIRSGSSSWAARITSVMPVAAYTGWKIYGQMAVGMPVMMVPQILIVLVGMLGLEIYQMCTVPGEYFTSLDHYLHSILTIVVGLEFVRMLIDMTPANTLEVLIVAIARQVILSHDSPWSNVASVLCIAGLFAIRRFLIPKGEMTMELSEMGEEEVFEEAERISF